MRSFCEIDRREGIDRRLREEKGIFRSWAHRRPNVVVESDNSAPLEKLEG